MRILFEQIQSGASTYGFMFTALLFSSVVFMIALWLALRMPPKVADRMANQPLDDSLEVPTPTHSSTTSVPHAKK